MVDILPFSQACENNKRPILHHLQHMLADHATVLEIGGGTGQHAVFFARHLSHLHWHSSDVPDHVAMLNQRIAHAALPNLPPAMALDVNHKPWPCAHFDTVFTANSLHIMSVTSVENFFAELPEHLNQQGQLLIYGPFRYRGDYTTASNARFDQWLQQQDPRSGLRDFEWIDGLAAKTGLRLTADKAMPANNQLLRWQYPP